MNILKSRVQSTRDGIIYLRPEELKENPVQPRKSFDEDALRELSESIRTYGILNPLTVRLRCGRYELVAGERRLRAAKMAGLREVPCMLFEANMEDAGVITLIENIQRRDLDFIEEAMGISRLIRMFGLSQEECARKLGKSQSAVANKLRLLKLPEDVLETLRDSGLTERHARALLRLPNGQSQREALTYIAKKQLNVADTDAYIDALLSEKEGVKEQKRTFVLKDVRVFLNTVTRSISMMNQGGIAAGMERQETEDSLILTISIPKGANLK